MRTNRDSTPPDLGSRDPGDGPIAAGILASCDGLADTLRTAEALVIGRRRVDLHGLDGQVRDLCARALGLPPESVAILLPKLRALMARIDSLLGALSASDEAEPS